MQVQSALISFKGYQYQLCLKASRNDENQFLQISLSSVGALPPSLSGKKVEYFHEFSPEYIENMTLKTGNFKKFQLFVEMLFSGLDKSTNTISLDILTMKDLQQKGKGNVQHKGRNTSEGEGFGPFHELDTKLYLIVTYAVAFDRVHYPLPLVLQDEKSYAELYTKYLQVEKDRLATVQELSTILRENDRLKHSMKTSIQDPSKFILSEREYRDLQYQLNQMKSELSNSSTDGVHQRIYADLINIVQKLSLKVFPATKKGSHNEKDEKRNSSKSSSKTPRSLSANQPLSSSSRNNSLNKSHSSYGSFGPAPAKKPYKVIKSEPLDKPSRATPKNTISKSREPSRSPFRRFDPTRYVLEKEAKLEEKRSRSLGGSRSSFLGDNRGSRSSSISSLNRVSLTNQRPPSTGEKRREDGPRRSRESLHLSKERPTRRNEHRESVSPSGFRSLRNTYDHQLSSVQRDYQLSSAQIDRQPQRQDYSKSRTRADNEHKRSPRKRNSPPLIEKNNGIIDKEKLKQFRDPDPDGDKIDERLAKLQQYLQAVLK